MILTRRRAKNFVALFFLIPLYGIAIVWLVLALFFTSAMDANKIRPGMTRQEAYEIVGKSSPLIEGNKTRWHLYDGDIIVEFDADDRVLNATPYFESDDGVIYRMCRSLCNKFGL